MAAAVVSHGGGDRADKEDATPIFLSGGRPRRQRSPPFGSLSSFNGGEIMELENPSAGVVETKTLTYHAFPPCQKHAPNLFGREGPSVVLEISLPPQKKLMDVDGEKRTYRISS